MAGRLATRLEIMHRFYIPPSLWDLSALTLYDDEARHCREVLRHQVGDVISVFNGVGERAVATIREVSRHQIWLDVETHETTSKPRCALRLGQAVPKGKNMDLIVQKATELGVTAISPLITERTVVHVDPRESRKKQEKWQRVALEACKQCGQDWLPEVHPPSTLNDYLEANDEALQLVAAIHDSAQPLHAWLNQEHRTATAASILIGPEGDFSPSELTAAMEAGYLPLSLGNIILRVETASIYALSIVGYELSR